MPLLCVWLYKEAALHLKQNSPQPAAENFQWHSPALKVARLGLEVHLKRWSCPRLVCNTVHKLSHLHHGLVQLQPGPSSQPARGTGPVGFAQHHHGQRHPGRVWRSRRGGGGEKEGRRRGGGGEEEGRRRGRGGEEEGMKASNHCKRERLSQYHTGRKE